MILGMFIEGVCDLNFYFFSPQKRAKTSQDEEGESTAIVSVVSI